jgi:hypothetical protein
MQKRFKIGKCNILLVFRHRLEKGERKKKRWDSVFKGEWRLGIWLKRNKMVGMKDFTNPKKWGDNLVNSYMLGIDLLIIKAWVSWDINGMHLEMGEDLIEEDQKA